MVGDSVQLDILTGRVLDFPQYGAIKLEKILGGGATAVVFKGVDPYAPEDREKWVAVKVARFEREWAEALVREWKNLTRLEVVEARTGTHYFPRIQYPRMREHLRESDPEKISENHLVREQRMLVPGQGAQWMKWICIVMEFVPSAGVHDLVTEYPDVRLPEPLALAVAEQYAHMLTILHGAGIACADRKLADLRWRKRYDIRYGERSWLQRWQAGEPPGELMVLDWNVTEKATSDAVRSDLWRFGVLFTHMTMAYLPRFRQDNQGQMVLEEPLEGQPAWNSLTYGTQQILQQLFHPLAEKRYANAASLLADVRKQVDIWRKPMEELWARARQLSQLQESGHLAERSPEELEQDANLIAVGRVLVEKWQEEKPIELSLPRLETGINRVLARKAFSEVGNQLMRGQLEAAGRNLERLRRQVASEPARALWVERYQLILEGARSGEKGPPLLSLLDVADTLYEPRETGAQEKLAQLDRWGEQFPREPWSGVIKRLRAERDYKRVLDEFRQSKGDVEKAAEKITVLRLCRSGLSETQKRYLDLLYGNADEEIARFEEEKKQRAAWEHALVAVTEAISRQDWAEARRIVQDVLPEGGLRRNVEQIVLCLANYEAVVGNSLVRAMEELCRYHDLLQAVRQYSTASSSLEKLENEYVNRRTWLARKLIAELEAALEPSSNVQAEEEGAWSFPDALSLLLHHFVESFPDDADFRNAIQDRVKSIEEEVRRYTADVESKPVVMADLRTQERNLERARVLAQWGSAICQAMGWEWKTLPPEVIDEFLHNKRESNQILQLKSLVFG